MSLMSKVTTRAPALPSRIYLYAAEKFGKSSFATHAPRPIFIMTEGETGLLSLIESGRVPETAHFPDDARTWDQLIDCVQAVRDEEHDYKTLVLDTSNGAERLLVQHVCDTEFGGQMSGKEGYASYGKGDLATIPHWMRFLRLLDEIRIKRRMSIILLAHSRIRSVNNPEGSDYDQLRPEGVEKLWTLTHKWADVIAAGTFEVFVKDDKVRTGQKRVIRTGGSLAVVAGNRYSLPEVIPCGNDAKSAFTNFAQALAKAKANGKKQEPATPQVAPPTPQVTAPEPPQVAPPVRPDPDPVPAPAEANHLGTPNSSPDQSKPDPVLQECHQCDLTWEEFLAEHGEDLGLPVDYPVVELDEAERASVLAKLRQVYAVKHPRKAKKEGVA